MNMNTTHFVIMNNVNTMNMMHIMNHHNTTETVSNVVLTGWDVVIVVLGFILLLWSGIKVTEWLLKKTDEMNEPWSTILFISGMFGYVIIGGFVICLLVCI